MGEGSVLTSPLRSSNPVMVSVWALAGSLMSCMPENSCCSRSLPGEKGKVRQGQPLEEEGEEKPLTLQSPRHAFEDNWHGAKWQHSNQCWLSGLYM
eukprot:1149403-Pelagomonas_calceolata.AAC.12